MALNPEIKDKLNSGLSDLGDVAKELLSYTGKIVKEAGLEAEKKAKNIGKIARLNSERTDAENKLLKHYAELGRYFYEQNMDSVPNEYAAFFDQIRLSDERLRNVNLELKAQESASEEIHAGFGNEMSFEQRINEIEKEIIEGSKAQTVSFDPDSPVIEDDPHTEV